MSVISLFKAVYFYFINLIDNIFKDWVKTNSLAKTLVVANKNVPESLNNSYSEYNNAYSDSENCECTHVSDTTRSTIAEDPYKFSESSNVRNFTSYPKMIYL